jgi:hypothetical protein
MNKIALIILLSVSLVAAGLIGFMAKDREALSKRLISSEATLKTLREDMTTLLDERDRLKSQLKSQAQTIAEAVAPKSSDAALAPPAKIETDNKPSSLPDARKGIKAWAEMLKAPGMKELMKQQQLAALEQQYGGLFARFQLNDAEKADFKQLISERLTAEQELGIELMSEGLTPEQRKAYGEQIAEVKKASDAKIKEFLNSDEDFKTYQDWEGTKAERMQLEMGRSTFANSGEPLSPQQEEQLVNAMHQVNLQPSSVPDLSKPENVDPLKMTPADIEQQLARYDANAKSVHQQAQGFLSPKQLEALVASQQQWRVMVETGLKMSSMMFQQEGKK